jgi:hypothetical protein
MVGFSFIMVSSLANSIEIESLLGLLGRS